MTRGGGHSGVAPPANGFDRRSGTPLERAIFNHRAPIVLTCALVTLALGWSATRLEVNASFERMIPRSHPYIRNYLDNAASLRHLGNAVRIVVENTSGDIYEPRYLKELQEINDAVLLLPGVDRGSMRSLWTPAVRWTEITEEGYRGGSVMPDDYDASPVSIAALRRNVALSGITGSIVANDQRSSLILVPLLDRDPETRQPLDYRAFSQALEAQLRAVQDDATRVHVVGFAKLMGDLIGGLTQVLGYFAIAALIALAVIYSYTRCMRSTLLVVGCSLVAVLWQLGLVRHLGFTLDPYSILVPFLVFAIGVSHGAQKMNGIMQDVGRGAHRYAAARLTYRRLFLAGLTALLADAVGFGAMMLIDVPVIRDLAFTASLGVAVLIFTNLILLPVSLSYVGVSGAAARRSLAEERRAKDLTGVSGRLIRAMLHLTDRRWAVAILVATLALAAGGFALSRRLEIGDLDPGAPELRADSRYNRDNAYVNEHYGLSSDLLAVIVRTPPEGLATYPMLVEMDRLEQRLRAVDGVQTTASAASEVRFFTAGSYEGNPKWMTINRDPVVVQQALTNVLIAHPELGNLDRSVSPILAYLRDHRAETLTRVVDAVEAFAKEHGTTDRQFLLGAGSAGIEAATNLVVARASHRLLLLVYGAVTLLCFVNFRSWRAVVVAVAPLLVTSILCEALMVALGIGVKVATLPVIALGVGIGVDYALYLLSVQLAAQRSGRGLTDAYQHALGFTGKVVGLVGLTLAGGVVTWAWSPVKFQADMGILLTFMFLWNMVGTVVLIPALSRLLLPDPRQRLREGRRWSWQLLAVALLAAWGFPAGAFQVVDRDDLHVRWDTSVKYSVAARVQGPSSALVASSNLDDGDRNFGRGLISSRFDLLSELDVAYRNVGARVSGAGWYDFVYNRRNDNDSPATANSFSVPHDEFTHVTRRLHGRDGDLLDAFAFANGRIGPVPASIRVGRHTLLWGESLLLATNGISYAQAPLDFIKALSVPGTQAKELFMPVGQISGQLRPTQSWSLAAYYQFEWRRTRLPAAGSYFSSADLLDEGGERLFTGPPGEALFRGRDLTARSQGQWGVSARYRAESLNTEFGLYWIWFHEKLPQLYLAPGAGAEPGRGQVGEYLLVFPEDARLGGASFATAVGGLALAGEAHVRFHTPLASTPQAVLPGEPGDNRDHPRYAVGNTVHAQVSSVYVLPRLPVWASATVLAEVGWQRRLAVTRNPGALDPSRDVQAFAFGLVFTPAWLDVLPEVDLNLPISFSYSPAAKAPLAAFDAVHDGGTLSVSTTAVYRKVWNAGMQLTYFYGNEQFQALKDRAFASFLVQRTF